MQLSIRPLINNQSKDNLYASRLSATTVFFEQPSWQAVLEVAHDYPVFADHILV